MSKQWESWKNSELGAKRMAVHRIEPVHMEGNYIGGFQTALPLAMKLDDVCKTIRNQFGGGVFLVYLDPQNGGDYLRSIRLEFSGLPKVPKVKCDCPLLRMMNQGCRISWHG